MQSTTEENVIYFDKERWNKLNKTHTVPQAYLMARLLYTAIMAMLHQQNVITKKELDSICIKA